MPRLFVALALPDEIGDSLLDLQSGLDGAKWRPFENFHLTLRFIGDVDRHQAEDIASLLDGVDAPAFSLSLSGCGSFGDRRPRAVWAGAEANPALAHLQSKVESAVVRAGRPPETRKFTPHVTLAYLQGARRDDVAAYVAAHGLFRTGPFEVAEFHLMSSRTGGAASVYETEASFPLLRPAM
ncbi:MAG: RNA 2',3'-cyclic phosphodiesterase [Pseudomonadota bacterium]